VYAWGYAVGCGTPKLLGPAPDTQLCNIHIGSPDFAVGTCKQPGTLWSLLLDHSQEAPLISGPESAVTVDWTCKVRSMSSLFPNRRLISLACTRHGCAAVTTGGQVYTWGDNSEGLLGLSGSGLQCMIAEPTRLHMPVTIRFVSSHMFLNSF